jgi:polyisoprenyl-teichoic acid--peptidoglycan teichoic acid transferase
MSDMNPTQTARLRNQAANPVTWFLLVAFLVAVAAVTYLTYVSVRDFVSHWKLTGGQGIALPLDNSQPTSTPNALGTPAASGEDVISSPLQEIGPEPKPWDGGRVTVLVMGLDYGAWSEDRQCPCRTDTMILLTIDPDTRSAGILNIPRDLWVSIPGADENGRINTAYFLGQAWNLPEGGPGLAVDTVEQFLGVPINFYAQIDFRAFEKFINAIGGIELDIKEKIKVDPIGEENTVTLKPGKQRLRGPIALAYARARYTEGGDFDRANRQQEVIMAILDRVTDPQRFPDLLSKAPVLYDQLSKGIHTNMTLEQAIQLAWLVYQFPKENIKRGVIAPPDMVELSTAIAPDGTKQDILIPVPDKIRELRDTIFGITNPASPLAAAGDPKAAMQAEAARVVVNNGSSTSGLAARTQDYLKTQGVNVVAAGNADGLYAATTIIDYTGKPYTVKFLMDLMGVQEANIYSSFDPNKDVDVAVVIGEDWSNSNPMPAP